MALLKYIVTILILTILTLFTASAQVTENTISEEKELHQIISDLDRIFFTAYNTCDLETQEQLISEDLEFYHDKGGLSTSKTEMLAALKNNICGKIRRELVEGSIEVTEIPDFGAVQMGLHKFYNNEEPNAISKPSKFVTLWKKTAQSWQMTRVISLHN
jgi:hypothetical protein